MALLLVHLQSTSARFFMLSSTRYNNNDSVSPIMDCHFVRSVAAVLWLLPAPVRAEEDWKALVGRSRELSMSGILGLVETDILFADAEPGIEQYEIWRILRA